jgi:hypothetical protein
MRLFALPAVVLLAGCTSSVPYRDLGFADTPSCKEVYAAYDRAPSSGPFPEVDEKNPCWRRNREEHEDYDLLFVEFDDQGWVQRSAELPLTQEDFLSAFFAQLDRLHQGQQSRPDEHGLSLVVYVHGWHHNTGAADEDVHSFRRMLKQIVTMEQRLKEAGYLPMRVVGIFVGWRGESVPVPVLRKLTFWDRKAAAERVAQGSVRELLKRLDEFRDTRRAKKQLSKDDERRGVRMLTIGHSFGGLITFQSMSSEFVRYAVRFGGASRDRWMSRVGDLVMVVNPALEGTRYEPLRAAGPRLKPLDPRQLPVLIVATSDADWATGIAFPLARAVSTILQSQPGEERDANVKAVGHNERYITHDLALGTCQGEAQACRKACPILPEEKPAKIEATVADRTVEAEYQLMRRIEQEGVANREYLCGGLELAGTDKWRPEHNPFWVVRTTKEVIKDHGDIFNPNFVAFMRQMYLGFIFARFERAPPR